MSLLGIAIIGKSNEPHYLCNCETDISSSLLSSGGPSSNNTDPPVPTGAEPTTDSEDAFAFVAAALASEQRNSLPIHRQILIHAALDSLDEMIQSNGVGQMPVIKHPTKHVPHWVGLVREVEELHGVDARKTCVYAYITATNIKFMALTQGTVKSAPDLRALQAMMKELHQHYSMYISNPFCNTRGPIVSSQFDARVTQSMNKIQQPAVIVD